MKKIEFYIAILFIPFVLLNCSSDSEYDDPGVVDGTARMEIRLTDAPSPYDEVNIDIRSISVNSTNSETSGWREFSMIRPGVYNLLHFQNGIDTLLGVHNIPAGELRQIRLELGSNNTVKQNNYTYYIFAPTGKEEAITIKLDANLPANATYKIWLDFDAARSLVAHGMGFSLNPVIRTYTDRSGGIIEGVVLPSEANTRVWAYMGKDTLMTYPGPSGYYRFSGLTPSGSWKIVFDASNRTYYQDVVRENITVTQGGLTVIPTVMHTVGK